MSEKRRPEIVFVAVFWGKIEPSGEPARRRRKIELFHASQWGNKYRGADKYRIRCDGKWFNGNEAYTLSEAMDLLRRSVVAVRKKRRRNARTKAPPLGSA